MNTNVNLINEFTPIHNLTLTTFDLACLHSDVPIGASGAAYTMNKEKGVEG